jgi:pimeloyl-ACP methyl ester carboxylesterase
VQIVRGGSETVVVANGFYLAGDLAALATNRTLIFYDLRNRGQSDAATDPATLGRGVRQDVDDLDAVRRHFGLPALNVIGHSYVGLILALYAMKYAGNVARAVLIGPIQPDVTKQYPAHLTGADATLADVMTKLGELQKNPSGDAVERCKKFWAALRPIYVTDPRDADKITWERCDLPNELNFMRYWMEYLHPSMRALKLTAADFARASCPVLIVHGRRDRSSPYGGAREWAMALPNARLVTIDNAAHAPWIEDEDRVFGAIERFLDGQWPNDAEQVLSLDPAP